MWSRLPRGFTLIELMIVVSIIGCLAAIAVPNYLRMTCRSKQSEAKTLLKQIVVAEEAYRAENDLYATADVAEIQLLGVVVAGVNRRYDYQVPAATVSTFSATADAIPNSEVDGDLWTISQLNDPFNVVNICKSK